MGLSGFQIKMIAIVAMAIDHLGAVVFQNNIWMRVVGRTTMPIMCYFIAEGYYRTRDKRKYALRLFVFAVLSEIPFQMCFARIGGDGGNVLWTLLLGMLALWTFDSLLRKGGALMFLCAWMSISFFCFISTHMPVIRIVSGGIAGADIFFALTDTDYSWMGVIAVVLAGWFHPKGAVFENQQILLPVGFRLSERSADIISKWMPQIALTGLVYTTLWGMDTSFLQMEFKLQLLIAAPMLGSVFLTAYAGRRGYDRPWMKYLFYGFYPLHLLLIALMIESNLFF